MRDLTKSMLSFSWALPLFGLRQVANGLAPDRATQAFDAVTEAARRQLGPMTDATFRAGDALQRSMVDVMFSFVDPRLLDPRQWMQWSGDLAGRGAQVVEQAIPGVGGSAPAGGGPAAGGWGGGATAGGTRGWAGGASGGGFAGGGSGGAFAGGGPGGSGGGFAGGGSGGPGGGAGSGFVEGGGSGGSGSGSGGGSGWGPVPGG